MKELRLGLKGRTLVFPDGRAVCLACGGEPSGTRQVWFETIAGGPALSREASLGRGVAAIAGRISFDAPLCRAHHRAAWMLLLKALGFGALGLALLVAGMSLVPDAGQKGDRKGLGYWLPMIPALIPWLFAYFAWQKKDRGGLSCEARREGADLVLSYPEPGA